MPDLQTILTVALAGLALSVTPGPSMLYVLSRSVGQSRAAGLASAVGLGLGGVLLALATALGLAAVFSAFAWIVPMLRSLGSIYLVWLGIAMIRTSEAGAELGVGTLGVAPMSISGIVRQGILIELLNPKTVLFFALFLPPFVVPEAGSTSTQLLVLGALVPLTAIPSDIAVAWLGGTAARLLRRTHRTQRALGWIGGLTLIAIAANLHLDVV